MKYNHLVANCLIFYAVATMSRVLAQAREEGYPVEAAAAALSPYITGHLNRFGHYTLDPARVPVPLDYDLPIFTPAAPQQGGEVQPTGR